MNNIFKDGFEEPKANFPDKVMLEIMKSFETATQGLASLSIQEMRGISRLGLGNLGTTFQYKIVLTSKYLKEYSFEVTSFGYDVSIYPVMFHIEEEIASEMGIGEDINGNCKLSSENEEQLVKAVEAVFSTEKFKNTVGGLMKIARSRMERT